MIDLAMVAVRKDGKTTTEAIIEACRPRSRPNTYAATAQAKLLAKRQVMAALNAQQRRCRHSRWNPWAGAGPLASVYACQGIEQAFIGNTWAIAPAAGIIGDLCGCLHDHHSARRPGAVFAAV